MYFGTSRSCKTFVENYTHAHGLPVPGRLPNAWEVTLLPSDMANIQGSSASTPVGTSKVAILLANLGDCGASTLHISCFPVAALTTCDCHAGCAHHKQLEMREKQKVFTDTMISKYNKQFPEVSSVCCHCPQNHKSGCGCLCLGFIARPHTDFTSILMACNCVMEDQTQAIVPTCL